MTRRQFILYFSILMVVQEVQSADKQLCKNETEISQEKQIQIFPYNDLPKDLKKVIAEFICGDQDFAKATREAIGFAGTNKKNRALVISFFETRAKEIRDVQKELEMLLESEYLNYLGYFFLTKQGGVLGEKSMERGLHKVMVSKCFYPCMFEILTIAGAKIDTPLLWRSKIVNLIAKKILTKYACRVLINYKNNLSIPDPEPYLPPDDLITEALKNDNKQAAQFLLECGEDSNIPLLGAISRNDLEGVRLLLRHNANSNKSIHHKYAPIIVAIDKGHFDMVKLLVENGADPKVFYLNMSALNLARKLNKPDIVSYLENLENPKI